MLYTNPLCVAEFQQFAKLVPLTIVGDVVVSL